MAVGKGSGYSESDTHRPSLGDIDARSMDPEDFGAMEDPGHGAAHPAHVTGTLDTTGVGVPDSPSALGLLPNQEGVANIPDLGYAPPQEGNAASSGEGSYGGGTGDTGHIEPAPEGKPLSSKAVKEAADNLAGEIQNASGVEEEVRVTVEELPSDAPKGAGDGEDLDALHMDELRDRARKADVQGFSNMNKDELVKALKKAQK